MLHISIKPEVIFELLGFPFTNSYLTSIVVLLVLIGLCLYYSNQIQKKNKSSFFYFLHFLVSEVYKLLHGVTKDKTPVFFPLTGGFFFYILLNNWFGLLPGVGSLLIKVQEHGEEAMVPLFRGGNADLNTTLMLGLISVIAIQYYGIKYLGFGGYMSKFINFENPINFFLGLLEIISEISRVLSFSFRLFGNIFAGEVLLAVIAFLIPVLVSFPFLMMEVFVGVIQALVFAILSQVLLQMATTKHHA